MSRAVLISIHPDWVRKIFSGAKTIEVRKTRPKLEPPFKVYVYRTLPNYGEWIDERAGRVVGEFVCDEIAHLNMNSVGITDGNGHYLEERGWKSCLTTGKFRSYCGTERPYGWHIVNPVKYDKLKPLNSFELACNRVDCRSCNRWDRANHSCIRTVTRPSQSWMYVEELK